MIEDVVEYVKYNIGSFFFLKDTAPTEIYTLSLHDALPIWPSCAARAPRPRSRAAPCSDATSSSSARSEEHTSELQSRLHLVCRLLLGTKKKTTKKETNDIMHAHQMYGSSGALDN